MAHDLQDVLAPGLRIYETGRLKWLKYHAAHPIVWVMFDRFALQSFARRKRYSPWSVGGRVRWEVDFTKTEGEDYKLSNNHIAYYSRAWMLQDPVLRGRFFVTRPMRGEDYEALLQRLGRPVPGNTEY